MIELPFPPSILSGHNNGAWYDKNTEVKAWRMMAKAKTIEAGLKVLTSGDIRIHVRFVPPDRKSDRVNMPNRMKPIFDGIADALKVNDSRFLPSYEFAEPEKPGRVEVSLG